MVISVYLIRLALEGWGTTAGVSGHADRKGAAISRSTEKHDAASMSG
jgi:hypothetical protein